MSAISQSTITELAYNTFTWPSNDSLITDQSTPVSGHSMTVVSYPRYVQIVALIVGIPIIFLGALGNLATIFAVAKSKLLRSNSMNLFVVSLSISDILYCSTILPVLMTVYAENAWILGPGYCKVYATFLFTFVGATLMCLAAISLSRYMKMRHAAVYNRYFTKYGFISGLIIIAWLLPVMFLFPAITGLWGGIGYEPRTLTCTFLRDNTGYNRFFMVSALILPTAFIVTFYLLIFCMVQANHRRIHRHNMQLPATTAASGEAGSQRQVQKPNAREDLSFTRMMIAIFVAFILCYFPYILTNLVDPDVTMLELHFFAGMCCWFSSCLNPMLYVHMNRQFRRAFSNLALWRTESTQSHNPAV
ncbi:protein trapped in endoderm-1-like [Diadema antillarum]|uniref:protein trapped in endoderm-1-like n=1 Tax=Diadema antillarum TaxID=105358 RepID=UPI003A83C701